MKFYEYGQKRYTVQQLREIRKSTEASYEALKKISREDFEAKEEIEKIDALFKNMDECLTFLRFNNPSIPSWKIDELERSVRDLNFKMTLGDESVIC